jgi:LytS/YehU family sensor histidine kinase
MQGKVILFILLLSLFLPETIFSKEQIDATFNDISQSIEPDDIQSIIVNHKSDSLVEKLQQLINEADSLHDHQTLSILYKNLSILYEFEKVYKSAFDNFYYSKYYLDSARIQLQNKQIEDAQSKYDIQKSESELEYLNNTTTIQKQKIRNHNYLLTGIAISIVLVLLIAILLIQNNTIKSKNKIAEMTQMNLKQHLNPEFIFNTLNSIQYSLFLKDRGISHKLLSKFARLMRSILDNSQYSTIPIKNEIEGIKLLLELEKLKHQDSFFFRININEELETIDYTIPALTIYPFIEDILDNTNRQSKIQINLDLNLSLKLNKLLCTITETSIFKTPIISSDRISPQNNPKTKLIKSIYQKIELVEHDLQITSQKEGIMRTDIYIPIQNMGN